MLTYTQESPRNRPSRQSRTTAWKYKTQNVATPIAVPTPVVIPSPAEEEIEEEEEMGEDEDDDI